MSDLAPSPADSFAAWNPTGASRPHNPTETAPQPNPAQPYPPRAAETVPGLHPSETYLASPAAEITSAEAAKRPRNARHFTRIWRRAWLQALAVLAAAMVGVAFGYVVAGNDHRMQMFFSAAVGTGLFLVFSAFATQLYRKFNRTRLS